MIAELKERLDVIACLSHFGVSVPASGRNVVACLCPFHEERTPSFMVYKSDNRAWCFGCNRGGDVLDLTRRFQDCSTSEAVAYWKDRLGLEGLASIPPSRQTTEVQQLRRLRDHVRHRSIEAV